MDKQLVRKFETDKVFAENIAKVATDYVKLGRNAVDYYSGDFDFSYDMLMGYRSLEKEDFDNLERGHPRRFMVPMVSTQLITMATYVSQMLFGQETPHRVSPRGPEDEVAAEYVNQLLRWNSERQPMYMLGYLWTLDALTANRGVFYNCWCPVYGPKFFEEEAQDPDNLASSYKRIRQGREIVGGYARAFYVSPYEFICDPALPLWRFQEGRFSGHRTQIPMVELERRALLDPTHPEYVMGWAVNQLKSKKSKTNAGSVMPPPANPPTNGKMTSRSAYERERATQPTNQQKANKDDNGIVNCHVIFVRLVPHDYQIYTTSSTEPTIFTILVGDDSVVLNFTESTYAHMEFPYSVGEAKPNGMYQFSPSWASFLKGLQDYVDYLKDRHQEAITRTTGNVFIYDPTKVDMEDFLDPKKEGKLIPLKPDAGASKISDVIQQIPMKDLTENFQQEMISFLKLSEAASGATSQMQGQAQGDSSATEFAGSQQMSAGRMSSIARMLSVQGIAPQTGQFVSMFQQFLQLPQALRFVPTEETPDQLLAAASLVLTRDLIQGSFDLVANDGTLPGTDGKKVAAITRLLETAAAFPQIFTPAPGNLDPRRLIAAAAKASGVSLESFKYRPQDVAPAPGAGAGGPPSMPGQPPGPPPSDTAPPGIPPLDLGVGATPPQVRPGMI